MIVSGTSRANFRRACVRVKHAGVAVHQNRKLTLSGLNEHYDGLMEKFWVGLVICEVLDE